VADEGYLVSPQPQLLRAESECLPGKAKSGKAARAGSRCRWQMKATWFLRSRSFCGQKANTCPEKLKAARRQEQVAAAGGR